MRIGVLYSMSAEPRWFTQEENPFPVLPMGTTYDICTVILQNGHVEFAFCNAKKDF